MLENFKNAILHECLALKVAEVENLKARVEALSITLAEMESALKENQEFATILSEKEEALSILLQKKYTRPEAEGILPLKGETMPSTSDDVKKLALFLENLARPSHPGTKKLSDLSFLGNIFPTEAISHEDGTKETTSTSVESVPSTKKVPDEAFVLHEFPFLNIPPPEYSLRDRYFARSVTKSMSLTIIALISRVQLATAKITTLSSVRTCVISRKVWISTEPCIK